MKTTIADASELGETMRPSDHMVRALTAARNVASGDRIRVRQHRTGGDGTSRKWHTVLVEGVQQDRTQVLFQVDKWPIAYMCAPDEMVELLEIQRTATFRCFTCHRSDSQEKTTRAVSLADFIDAELVKSGGLHVVILESTAPNELTGYCREHAIAFLS